MALTIDASMACTTGRGKGAPLRAAWWPRAGVRDRLVAAIGLAAALVHAQPMLFPAGVFSDAGGSAGQRDRAGGVPPSGLAAQGRETLVGGYVGLPYHDRSDVHMQRPGGTNVTLKGVSWYGEPFKFPLYAGIRATRWTGPFGFMIDFLHDKAVARTGKGAHGSRVAGERAIPEIVEASGMLKGAPVARKLEITEILERLEFTHGHNMILPTAMLRFGWLSPRLKPYVGVGLGAAIPHVEVWPAGEGETARTNEYQLAGPALQAVAGVEVGMPWGVTYVEYKFTYAWLRTSLTGGKTPSWCNCDFVSDFARHVAAWWRGEAPRLGRLSTNLATHQVVAGAGYRLGGGR